MKMWNASLSNPTLKEMFGLILVRWEIDEQYKQRSCKLFVSLDKMGFIINDTIVLSSGVELSGAYAAIRTQRLVIHGTYSNEGVKTFTVQTSYGIFKDKKASQDKLQPLETKPVKVILNATQLNGIFTSVYAAAKAHYSSTKDD